LISAPTIREQCLLEALVGADAFTGASRSRAGWDARGAASGPQALPLFAAAPETAAAAMTAQAPLRLLIAEGRVEREVEHAEVPITHLILRRLVDRSDLLDSLAAVDGGAPGSDWAERTLGHADEVRRPEPGSRRPKARLPGSRDFR
jgi:error-prone DNA polymerase